MEVIEHVADPGAFVRPAPGCSSPGGLIFIATMNRTLKSFGLAIIGAEYILGWLPKGTHQWEKFITPEELTRLAGAQRLGDASIETGVTYHPARRRMAPLPATWTSNYMLVAQKAGSLALSQFPSSGSIGRGWTSIPSSISALASSGVVSP